MAEDDLLKNYIAFQKRQKEILEEAKGNSLKNKTISEQTINFSKDTKDELNYDLTSKTASKNSLDYGSEEIKNNYVSRLSEIKNNSFSFEDASAKLKEGLDEQNYVKRGLNRFEKNDFKRAINDFTRALRLNPENTDIYLVRANAKIKCEQFKKAIEDFNLYFQCNPNNINALLDRGDCYLKLLNVELALKDFNEAYSFGSKEALAKIRIIENQLQKINNQKAEDERIIEKHTKKINENPLNPSFYFGRAMSYKKTKVTNVYNFELAIKDLCKSIDLNPEFEEAYLELLELKKIMEAYGEKTNEQEISIYLEKYELFKNLRLSIECRKALEREAEEIKKKKW